jgi:D-alanyl-D-alanine endopeptidase (penicillin-binding protein 7)
MYALVRSMGFDRSNFANLMNATALQLNMKRSRFVDAAGIDPGNVSTARDLAELLDAAADDPTIRQKTKIDKLSLYTRKGRSITLMNPDRLARSGKWDSGGWQDGIHGRGWALVDCASDPEQPPYRHGVLRRA